MAKKFYILRHGESTYNVEGRIQGHSDDSLLTELGREQAQAAGHLLANKGIEIIICSPLKRALETGEIIASIIHAPLLVDKRFVEVNVGIIEGMYYADVQQKYKSAYDKWRSSDKQNIGSHFKGGESKINVRKRVFEGLDHYALNSDYNNILIAGHGIILNQALMALGMEAQDIPNCAIICLHHDNNLWKFQGFISQQNN